MKKCVACGTMSQDQDALCGVCGASLGGLRAVEMRSNNLGVAVKARSRQVHPKGLLGLVTGLSLILSGWYMLGPINSELGFVLLLFGIVLTASILNLFKGLPYASNTGGHRGGDPDVVATNTRGSVPSNYGMYQADREIEARRKKTEATNWTCVA